MATVVGVISDTHGLLRPEAVSALTGCQAILHAGDVGDPAVLIELQEIAPVHAVRGNVDIEAWAQKLPLRRTVRIEDASILIVHDRGGLKPGEATRHQAVVFGHSHKPEVEEMGSTLYVNPGSAGPRRFSLPVSVARLVVDGVQVSGVVIPIL